MASVRRLSRIARALDLAFMDLEAARERLIGALDVPDLPRALSAAESLADHVGMLKIGLELFVGEGPKVVREIRERHPTLGIFLDLKLHDIPNTMAGAIRSARSSGANLITVHAGSGVDHLRACVDAAEDALGILAVIVLDVVAVNRLLPAMLGMEIWVRVVAVIVLLVPTGLMLGMPFPSGVRLVEEQCPHLVPWGWAINAFFSVFGSIFCIVLSMSIGFSNVFYVAACVYVLGLVFMKTPRGNAAYGEASDPALPKNA